MSDPLLHLKWVPAGIRGDGRNRFGQPAAPLNEYQGDFCGVRTVIYNYKRPFGGISFDTDIYYDAATMSGPCGSRRTVDFYLGAAPTTSSPHVLVGDLWNFVPGEVRLMNVTFGQELPCSTLQFDAQFAGASSARVTRLPDVSAVRQWRVESQGNHQAACMKQLKSDRQADTGLRYYLPFSIIIMEIPAPSASYP
jgi:hypothetical protein